jgi:hypothetical protein
MTLPMRRWIPIATDIGNAVISRIHAHIPHAGQKRGPANRRSELFVDSAAQVDWDSVVLTALLLVGC